MPTFKHHAPLYCCLILLAALPACDGDGPTAPGAEPDMHWSWSRPRVVWPTAICESEQDVVWLAGIDGRVLSQAGSAWIEHETGSEAKLRSIWCCGSHTYAVGDGGTILHFDGATWASMQAPYTVDLYEVWGTAPDNVWIVGHAGTVLRLVDGAWDRLVTDSHEPIRAIWGTGPADMEFGGGEGTLLHFDGSELVRRDTAPSGLIMDLLGTDDGRLYAAAVDLWVREDGTWSLLVEEAACSALATMDGDLYVRHGNTLALVDEDRIVRLPEQPFWACAVLGRNRSDRLLTVDTEGVVLAFKEHWSVLRSNESLWVDGISGTTASNVFAVGESGLVLRFDGHHWHREDSGTDRDLRGVWCSDSGKVFVVGAQAITVRSGGVWTPDPAGDDHSLYEVWGFADDDVYAVGRSGTILHFDGQAWTLMDCPVDFTLRGVWGSAPDDIFAVSRGYDGEILHYDGQVWSVVEIIPDNPLWSVWGTGPDNVYVVGWDGGAFYHYDGNAWNVEHQPWDATAHAVHGNGPDNVYVGGYQGGFWSFDGTVWRQIEPAFENQYTPDLWCAPDGQLFVATSLSGILRYGP